jgi:hypothetical protein
MGDVSMCGGETAVEAAIKCLDLLRAEAGDEQL